MNPMFWILAFAVGCSTPGETTLVDPTDPTEPTDPIEITELRWEHNADIIGPITVIWTQSDDATVYVEYDIDGTWLRTPDVAAVSGENRTTVIGVPLGASAAYRLILAHDDTQTVDGDPQLENQPIPVGVPRGTLVTSKPTLWESSGAHVMVPLNRGFDDGWLVIMDRDLQPIWVSPTGTVLYSQISVNGDSLLWGDTSRRVARRSYLDAPIGDTDLEGFHLAMVEATDGSLAWDDYNDIVELTPGSDTPERVSKNYSPGYTNGMSYDAASDAYVISSHRAAVTAVSRETGEILWASKHPFKDGGFAFDPIHSAFRKQHGAVMTPSGTLLVSTEIGGRADMREYEIDLQNETLRLVWEFTLSINASSDNSWVYRLAGGNSMQVAQSPHGGGNVYEVTADKQVAWRATFYDLVGRAQVIEDLYALVAP